MFLAENLKSMTLYSLLKYDYGNIFHKFTIQRQKIIYYDHALVESPLESHGWSFIPLYFTQGTTNW